MSQYLRKNDNIVKGDELWMFLGSTEVAGTTGTVPIAFSTQHSLNWSRSTNSVSSKDHGNTSYVVPGEGSWTVSTEALFSIKGETGAQAATFDTLMELKDANAAIDVKFGTLANYQEAGIVDVDATSGQTGAAENWELDTPYWQGKGYITSLQASGGHGDSATMSIEISGSGPLTKVTA